MDRFGRTDGKLKVGSRSHCIFRRIFGLFLFPWHTLRAFFFFFFHRWDKVPNSG
ncbi:hypothetical protein LX36DRAFT_145886 [Colletotrichum falcatum]|nr:hypothetical protein LX36DRAFT_145886 [Colletotrichum falcatum]